MRESTRTGGLLGEQPSRTRAIGTLHDVVPPPALDRHSGAPRHNAALPRRVFPACSVLGHIGYARPRRFTAAEPFRDQTRIQPCTAETITRESAISREVPASDRSRMGSAKSASMGRACRTAISARLRSLGVLRWDVRISSRAAAVGAVAFGVAWLVTAVTDEGGISWAERLGRVFPVAPACSAVGAWAALLPSVRRGETRALMALGCGASRIALPVVLGAAALSLATSVAIASLPWIGLSGFYPSIVHASAWVWREGSFIDLARGIAVGPSAVPVSLAAGPQALASGGTPAVGRAAAALSTGAAGLALPLLSAHAVLSSAHRRLATRGPWGGHSMIALVCILGVGATAVLFQSAAAGQSPALLATAPPLALLAFAVAAFGRQG